MRTTTLKWRPSRRDGHGPEQAIKLSVEDADYLRSAFEATLADPTAAKVASMRTLLDLFAYFPGTTFSEPPVRLSDGVGTDWGVRLAEEAARVADADTEPEKPSQPSLLDDPGKNTIGRFHADPKPTELVAAVGVFPRSGSQREQVLRAIAISPAGLLDEEIAETEGIADTAHRTRRNELVQGGWVEDSGRTRRTASGTDSIVWVLSAEGRRQYDLKGAA